jgi:hypothetical protein
MESRYRETISVQDERRMTRSDLAARWLDGEIWDCGGYILVARQGRVWTVGKRFPDWESRVAELLA